MKKAEARSSETKNAVKICADLKLANAIQVSVKGTTYFRADNPAINEIIAHLKASGVQKWGYYFQDFAFGYDYDGDYVSFGQGLMIVAIDSNYTRTQFTEVLVSNNWKVKR